MKKIISVVLSISILICFTLTPVAATYDMKNNSVVLSKSKINDIKNPW